MILFIFFGEPFGSAAILRVEWPADPKRLPRPALNDNGGGGEAA